MSRAVRKQVYFTPEQNRLVKELAAQWGTTEAAVVRKALDGLAEAQPAGVRYPMNAKQRAAREALRQAGMLVEDVGKTLVTQADLDKAIREARAMTDEEVALLRRRTERLGGGNDVIANREEEARIDIGQSLDDD